MDVRKLVRAIGATAPWAGQQLLWLIVDGLLLGVLLLQVAAYWREGVEDALISFRYAYNLAEGHGLVYNPGEHVEGISNLLWTGMLAGLYACGSAMYLSAYRLVFVCSLLSFFLIRWAGIRQFGARTVTSRLPLLFLACFTELHASNGNLLEGAGVMTCLSCILLGGVFRNVLFLGIGSVLLAWSRPEGMEAALLVMFWAGLEMRAGRVNQTRFLWMCLGILSGIVMLLAFRAGYYGGLIPNGARVKMACSHADRYTASLLGLKYVAGYIRMVGVPIAVLASAALVLRKTRSLGLLLLGLAAFNMLVVIQNGDDWMSHYRLLTPYSPLLMFAAVLCASSLPRRYHARPIALMLCAVCALATVQFQAGLWTNARDMLAPVLHVDAANQQEERVPGKMMLSCHLTPDDFREADDKLVLENGGFGGWMFRESQGIEMRGLTEPRLLDTPSATRSFSTSLGVMNLSVMEGLHPSYFQLAAGANNSETPRILRSGKNHWQWQAFFGDFLLLLPVNPPAEDLPIGPLLAREDRRIFPQAILDYGFICPVGDVEPDKQGENGQDGKTDSELPTVWLRNPWTDENGAAFRAGSYSWGDMNRLGWQLPMNGDYQRYQKPLLDDAPILLLVGIEPDSGVAGSLCVAVVNKAGERNLQDQLWLEAGLSPRIQTSGLVIPSASSSASAALELTFEGETPGNLLITAYRWTRGVTPDLPVEFVRTRLEQRRAYCQKSGDTAACAQIDLALEALAPDTDHQAEVRRHVAREAARLREAVLRQPKDEDGYEALSKLYLEAGEIQGLVREWTQMAARLEYFPLPWIHLARALLKAGDLDGATRCNDAIGKLQGPIAGLLREEAEAFTLAGQCEAAGKLYREAIERDLQNRELYEGLSACYERCGNLQAAIEVYRTVFAPDSKNYAAHARLAGLLVKAGDIKAAALEYRIMMDLEPNLYGPYENLSDSYVQSGDLEGLVAEWRETASKHPDRALAHLSLGVAYDRLERYDEAITAYRQSLDLDRTSDSTRRYLVKALVSRSQQRLDGGKVEESLADLQEALTMDAEYVPAYEALSVLHERSGDTRAAIDACKKAVALDSRRRETHARLMNLIEKMGDAQAATAEYQAMIDLEPEGYDPYEKLSDSYVKSGNLEGLLEEWRVAVSKHPDRALAHFSLGVAYDRLDRYDEAIASYQRALELNPKGEGTRNCLVKALLCRGKQRLDKGKAEEALADFREVLKNVPDSSEARTRETEALEAMKRQGT